MKLSGAKSYAATSVLGVLLTTGDTIKNTWYKINAVGAATALPFSKVGKVFKSPDALLSQITLAAGDELYPVTITKLCKTDLEVSFEEGVIDVTDDCEEGYTAEILDGYKKISGTSNGFTRFNDATQELEDVSTEIYNKFIDVDTDDGDGVYGTTVADNEQLLFFILLNKKAAVTEIQNWLIIPVIFTSLGAGAGLKDAQKQDLAWTKGEGPASLYKRTTFADDVI